MPKYSVMVCRFPGGNIDHPDGTDWLVETVCKMKADPRIGEIIPWRKSDTPIPMVRNLALEHANRVGVDFVLMMDNDMKPDAYVASNANRLAADPAAKPFWDTAFNFLVEHNGPAFVAAPYCGPPPVENVYIFRWTSSGSSRHPLARRTDLALSQFSREEAASRGGVEEVAALPTGLILMHTKCLDAIPKPYTYYEWSDESQSEKASTEDVTWTRDMSLAGIPIYCLWDCWAGHWKPLCVGKPSLLTVESVRDSLREAVLSGRKSNERLVMFGEGKNGHRPALIGEGSA